jgi:hypothetical protein
MRSRQAIKEVIKLINQLDEGQTLSELDYARKNRTPLLCIMVYMQD